MKKNRTGFTLAELIIAMVCGVILTSAAVIIIISMMNSQRNAQQELMREAEKKTAVEHLNISTRKSSYVKIQDGGGTLQLYNYNDNLTGTYPDQPAGLTYTDAALGFIEQFKDVRAAFTKTDGPAGIADKATEIKIDFTSPPVSTTYIKPRVSLPPLTMLYGGVKSDCFHWMQGNILQTNDDGYIFAGYTDSFGTGTCDSLVVKIDALGAIQWAKTYDISIMSTTEGFIHATNDGGYIFGVGNEGGPGGSGPAIVKINSSGNVQWAKKYCDFGMVGGIDPTADGGYLIAGSISIAGSNPPAAEALVIKINSTGDFQWAKKYRPKTTTQWRYYNIRCLKKTSDGGYILGGDVSSGGDVTMPCADILLIKLDSLCNLEWARAYNTGGATHSNVQWQVQEAKGGGYIMAGQTRRTDLSDKSLVIKTSSDGKTVEWAKTYYSSNPLNPRIDKFKCVQHTSDGGYIFIGSGSSASGYGAILVKTDSLGSVEWVKLYMRQIGASVVRTRDNGYVMANSMGNPRYGSPYDMAIVKTDSWGNSGYADIYMNKTDYIVSDIAVTLPAGFTQPTQSNITYTASSVSPTVVKRTLTVTKISDLF